MVQKIHTIVTHKRPHLDEVVAIWLVRYFGERIFPGASTARLMFWDSGAYTPDGRPTKDWEKEGHLLIGVGGSRFDEHPTSEHRKRDDECAATLIAHELGVTKDPALKRLLAYVLANDSRGTTSPYDLASNLKTLNARCPNQWEKVIEWASTFLDAEYVQQKEFFATRENLDSVATFEDVEGPSGKIYRLAVVEGDGEQLAKAARSRGAEIVIIRKSNGSVQVFGRPDVTLENVAAMLRFYEMDLVGQNPRGDWETLQKDGKVPGAEAWYYQKQGEFLFNGSLTAAGVTPTKVPFEHVKRMVRLGINPDTVQLVRKQLATQGRK